MICNKIDKSFFHPSMLFIFYKVDFLKFSFITTSNGGGQCRHNSKPYGFGQPEKSMRPASQPYVYKARPNPTVTS